MEKNQLRRDEVLTTLREMQEELRERYTVRRIGVFGSFAEDSVGAESDVDILVEPEEPTFDHYMDLKFRLEEVFDRPVELVMAETLKPRLRPINEKEVSSMQRDYRLFLDDVLEGVKRIREYTAAIDYERFKADKRNQDGVVRNLRVIGEAARSLPEHVKALAPQIDRKKIVGLRNILAHENGTGERGA